MCNKHSQEQRGVDHNYTEELSSGWRVFIYMSVHGINLYHVKASAASVQRLLVSFWRYLANENYDLSSEGFYSTSTLVSSASCVSPLFRLRLYAYHTPSSEPDWPSRTFYLVQVAHGNNSTCSRRYLSKNDDEASGSSGRPFALEIGATCTTRERETIRALSTLYPAESRGVTLVY